MMPTRAAVWWAREGRGPVVPHCLRTGLGFDAEDFGGAGDVVAECSHRPARSRKIRLLWVEVSCEIAVAQIDSDLNAHTIAFLRRLVHDNDEMPARPQYRPE